MNVGLLRGRFLEMGDRWRKQDEAEGRASLERSAQVVSVLTWGAQLVGNMVGIVGAERAAEYFKLVAETIEITGADFFTAPPSLPSSSAS